MFEFERPGPAIKEQFRRIALDQIRAALAESETAGADFGETVHRLRRRSKKLRGLLRLLRPVFRKYEEEYAVVRDAAAGLAHARDAAVIVQTVRDLADKHADEAGTLASIGTRLAAEAPRDPDIAALVAFHHAFEGLEERALTWKLKATGWDALGPGLKRTYASARRRMHAARGSDDPVLHHAWRKANKAHGYHIDLLRHIARDVLGHELKVCEGLSQDLGRHHDLSVLRERMDRDPDRFGTADERAELLGAIGEETASLARRAHDTGRQLYAEHPDAMLARYRAYWHLDDDGKAGA